jgi:predicted nucleic acid-binding Zn ribbon protein
MQSMSDDPVSACTECRSPVERVFRPVAVHFKGSGFYTTDYGRKRTGGGDSSGSANGKESKDSKEGSTDSSTAKSGGGAGKSESASSGD